MVLLEDIHDQAPVSGGAYTDPVSSAMTLPIMNAQGTAAGVLICGLSPNRALDDAYRSFVELVAGQVSMAIRNARSREDEQRRARKLAKLDKAKTAFFSNVSHEFRTPLTLILGPLEDALMDAPERLHAHRDDLVMAHRNALRLLRLVNTLLDFSRVEASRSTANIEPVDLAMLTADLASNFRTAIERAGMRLVVDTPPLSRAVAVDREMYEKIVLNLVSNAFKFTQQGTITVGVTEEYGRALLTVSDTGAGIPQAELDKVFVRFHQITGQPARSHEGSGIGLALVKQLVELQDGIISVSSEGEGRGATFQVSFPLAASTSPGFVTAQRPSNDTAARSSAFVEEAVRWLPDDEAHAPAPSSERRLSIVLADDNADMRIYVRRLLAEEYEMRTVPDGAEALLAIRERGPDLVISDIMMPRLDGFGLLRALREDRATATIPVIFLSARAGEEARVESLEAGADDHLVKPFSALELRARIAGALELAQLRGEKAARERVFEATRETLRTQGALARSEQQLQALADALPVLICQVSLDLRYMFVNQAYEQWLGLPLDQIVGTKIEKLIGSEAFALVRPRMDEALAGKDVQFETFMPYADIRPRHVGVSYIPQRSANGTVEGFYGLVQDITERKLAERHRELLVDELNHRVKNTLAIVLSIAAQSFKGERDTAEARAAFEGRLLALSDAHNLLTRESWDHVLLADVIVSAVRPFGEDRFELSGPDLVLAPKAAVSLALGFHELSTNAVKYGALSAADGKVRVSWSIVASSEGDGSNFVLVWQETGGPKTEPPVENGFGSRLIQRGLAAELGGKVDLNFAPEGVSCTISAPLSHVGSGNPAFTVPSIGA